MTMITYVAAANSIRSYWRTTLELAASLATQYDNAPPTQYEGAHAALSIAWQESQQISLRGGTSGARHRCNGELTVTIRIPTGQGDQSGTVYIDAINTAFCQAAFDGITFRSGTPTTLGQRGAFWEILYTIPFYFDQMVVPSVETVSEA